MAPIPRRERQVAEHAAELKEIIVGVGKRQDEASARLVSAEQAVAAREQTLSVILHALDGRLAALEARVLELERPGRK